VVGIPQRGENVGSAGPHIHSNRARLTQLEVRPSEAATRRTGGVNYRDCRNEDENQKKSADAGG
jgi:hypothetical protein